MRGRTRYTVLGWVVWRLGSRAARRKLAENRSKLLAALAAGLALTAGLAAARAGGEEGAGVRRLTLG